MTSHPDNYPASFRLKRHLAGKGYPSAGVSGSTQQEYKLMNTSHYVINNNNVIHASTQRGCKTFVTRNGKGRVITAEDLQTIKELQLAQSQLKKAEEAAAEELQKLFRVDGIKAGSSEYLKNRPLRYELRGELGRAMMAFAAHEHRTNHKIWCGNFNGGTFFFEGGTYYGWLTDTSYYTSAECLLAKIAAYARRAYRHWQGKDAFGVRVAADLLAATALAEEVTWVAPVEN